MTEINCRGKSYSTVFELFRSLSKDEQEQLKSLDDLYVTSADKNNNKGPHDGKASTN